MKIIFEIEIRLRVLGKKNYTLNFLSGVFISKKPLKTVTQAQCPYFEDSKMVKWVYIAHKLTKIE